MKTTHSQENEGSEKHPETQIYSKKDSDDVPKIPNGEQEAEKKTSTAVLTIAEKNGIVAPVEIPENVSKPWRKNMKTNCISKEGTKYIISGLPLKLWTQEDSILKY